MSTSKPARKKNLAGVPPLNVLSPNDRALRERIKALMLSAGVVGYRNGNTFVYYHRGRSKDLAGRLTIETPRTGDDWLTSFYHAATYATLHAALTAGYPVADRFPAFCEALSLDPRGEGLRAWEYAGQVDKEMRKFLGDARFADLLRTDVPLHAAARKTQGDVAPARARFVLRVTPGGFIALERNVPNASLSELANALRGGFREGEFRKSAKGYAFLPRNDEYRDTPGALALELARQLRAAGVAVAVMQDKSKPGASPVKKNGRPAVGGTMSSKGTSARRWTMADIKRANKAAGRYYFTRDTQRFFGPETYHGPYQGPGGVYFVKVGQRTGIKVVQFDPATGDVDTVHNVPAPTLDEGRKMARTMAASAPTAKPNGRAEPANETEAEELVLYTANERALYDRRKAFYDSALRKVRAGTYDPSKAPALFAYLADEAAKHYRAAYRMGTTGFSPATRRLAAEKFAREFEGSDEYTEAVAAKGQHGKRKTARKRNASAKGARNARRPPGGYDAVFRANDMRIIAETADRIRYSETAPETVMLSIGYADVYPEGDHEASATIHGVNHRFEEQQLHPERFRAARSRR